MLQPGRALRLALASVVVTLSLTTYGAFAQSGWDSDVPTPEDQARQKRETALKVPTLNNFAEPGVLDMPSAEMLPDGQLAVAFSAFADQYRLSSYFQLAPWLGVAFRYAGVRNTGLNTLTGFDPYYDRGFDIRFRLAREGRLRPAITVGLRDFAGTGIYSSEYLVATKTFNTAPIGNLTTEGRLKATVGLGWGRLGSYNSIGSTGSREPGFSGVGGTPETSRWFRGDVAPFAALEWQATPRLALKAEYSSDNYESETITGTAFTRRSPLNFGFEYQWTRGSRVGLSYMYGDAIGFKYEFNFNPRVPMSAMAVLPARNPVPRRPDPAIDPGAYSTAWASSQEQKLSLKEELDGQLQAEGALIENLALSGDTAEIWVRNTRYYSQINLVGRIGRIMAETLPASVETFKIVMTVNGGPLSEVTLSRFDLETLEFETGAADKLLATSYISDVAPVLENGLGPSDGLYPDLGYDLGPYFEPGFFDPDVPFRLDVGGALRGFYIPAPGWVATGTLHYRFFGNLADGRSSNSVLPRVRTDQALYAQEPFEINRLYAARYAKLREDVYGRVSVGYLEQMFGGISTEVLWKPATSPFGFGVEANYVAQRDYDGLFGFQDYTVFTGHASVYAEFGDGYLAQVDAGQYLAGDVGASFRLDREFDNGWLIGAFFTLTNVSAEDFGEGSFDKGFRVRIPFAWFTGRPNATVGGTNIRIIQRDGGQMLELPDRLYGSVRASHAKALTNQWARVWQ